MGAGPGCPVRGYAVVVDVDDVDDVVDVQDVCVGVYVISSPLCRSESVVYAEVVLDVDDVDVEYGSDVVWQSVVVGVYVLKQIVNTYS